MNLVNPWAIALQHLARAPQSAASDRARFNPRPPGVIRLGSATHALLGFFRQHPGRYYTREALVRLTGRTEKSIDWALFYLRSQALIEAGSDSGRNPRFLRYRLAQACKKAAPRISPAIQRNPVEAEGDADQRGAISPPALDVDADTAQEQFKALHALASQGLELQECARNQDILRAREAIALKVMWEVTA